MARLRRTASKSVHGGPYRVVDFQMPEQQFADSGGVEMFQETMSSQSIPNSQFVSDENSQPSSNELQSANKDSNSTPDPYVILTDNNDATAECKKIVEGGSGREKSNVWNHFTKQVIDGSLKAICKYCKKQMKGDSGSGTSHLNNHYVKKHNRKP
ncbi:hypothetical protein AgCh_006754 [Apium graveolens]